MTYFNNEPGTRQQRATPRGWRMPIITSLAGLAVGGVLATGITMTATNGQDTHGTACATAIGKADEAVEIYSQAFFDASEAMNAYTRNDYAAMDTHTANLNTAADDIEVVLTDYYLASDECLGG